jgi:hypothetical protein
VAADRETFVDLLTRWERGEISAWHIVEEAEDAEEAMYGRVQMIPELPKSDPKSILAGVLGILSDAHHYPILPVDVPVLVAFLGTEPGGELQAWHGLEQYLDSVDWQGRAAVELYTHPGWGKSAG